MTAEPRAPHRRDLLAGFAPLALLAGATMARANPLDRVTSIMPFGGYSVDGRRGLFLQQVAGRNFDQSGGANLAASLGSDAINRGEFQDAILDLPEVSGLVRQLLGKISAKWPYAQPKDIPVRIVGVSAYGADVLSDNSIKIYLGLIKKAETDDELAYSLAHEYSHVVLGHLSRNGAFQKQRQLIGGITRLYSQGVQLSEARLIKSGDNLMLRPGDRKKIVEAQSRASALSQRLRFLIEVMIAPNWSRKQEDEADALGYDLAATEYAAGFGASAAFMKLDAERGKRKLLADALQTQLDQSLRLATTEENVKAAIAGEGGSVLDVVWKDMQRGLREQGRKVVEALFSEKHRPPQERQKGLLKYIGDAHGGPAMKDTSTVTLKKIKTLKEYQDAVVAVEAVERCSTLRGEGKLTEAEAGLKPALDLKGKIRSTPFVANEAARLYAAQNRIDLSHQQFTLAHKHPNQSLQAYRDHVSMLLLVGRYDVASTVIAAAVKRFDGDRKPFLPAMIRIAFATRKDADGVKLLEECIRHEDPGLKHECITSSISPADTEKYDRLSPEMKGRIDRALLSGADTGQLTATNKMFNEGIQGMMKALGGR